MLTERLALLVSANVDGAVRGLQKVEKEADKSLGNAERRIDRLGAGFSKAGAIMLTAGGLMAAGMWKAGQAASDLEQAVGGSTAVFGEAIGIIDDFADTSAEGFGLSQRAARELTSQLGAMLKGFGFTREEAARTSVEITQLGSDLSAAFGGNPEEAVQALGAALRGERDPIERYGVSITAAAVDAKALEMGLASTKSELDANAKAQATLAIIMEQTSDIQGQFGREANTAAGQQARLKASMEDLAAAIGEGVLPIMRDGIGLINGMVGAFNGLPSPVQSTISKLAVATTGFLLVGGAVSSAVGQAIKMRSTLQGLHGGLSGASRATRGLAVAGGALAAVGMALALKEIADASSGLSIDIERAAKATTDELITGFEDMEKALGRGKALEQFRTLAEGSYGTAQDLRDGLVELGHSGEDLDAILADVAAGQERANQRASQGVAVTEDAADATDDYAAAQAKATAATEEAEKAQRDLVKAMDDVIDQAFGGLNALSDWEEGLDEIAESARENGTSLDLSTEAGRRNHRILQGLVEAGNARIQQLIAEGASTDEVRTAQWLMGEQLSTTAGRLGFSADQARIYRDALNSIPTSVYTTVNIAEIISRQKVTAAGGPSAGRYRARGGPVLAGQSYVVGEEGPELLTMGGNGYVHPNGSNTMNTAMSAPARGGATVVNNFTINALDPRSAQDAVIEALRQWERSNGPLPVRVR